MALPITGTISMSQINGALNRVFNASIGLKESQVGTYAAINQSSELRPNGLAPFSMGKWRGYNKDAGGGGTSYEVTLSNSCVGKPIDVFFLDTPSLVDATIIAYDSNLTNFAPEGFYSDGIYVGYWDGIRLFRVTRCGKGILFIGIDCFKMTEIAFTDSGDLAQANFLGSDELLKTPYKAGDYSDGFVTRSWDGRGFTGEIIPC